MQEYKRKCPSFSLCGLNCGLCPRYHTDGASKCPGCGGKDFHLKHPSCAIVSCNNKHDQVEYCFQCSLYPCERYQAVSDSDSFITYLNVISDFNSAQENGLDQYIGKLNVKMKFLEFLLANFNDGRRKNYYCLAVNLLPLEALMEIKSKIDSESIVKINDKKTRINAVLSLFEEQAKENGITLKLRKQENNHE